MSKYFRLLIRHKEQNRRFLGFQFKDNADGSLIIVFDYKGSEEKPSRLSYHPSGMVICHGNLISKANHFDPIFKITKPQIIASYSVPNLDRLTSYKSETENDFILDLSEEIEGGIKIALIIMPEYFELPKSPLAVITYPNWFRIAVIPETLFEESIPLELSEQFLLQIPPAGLYTQMQIDEEIAYIMFHKKRKELSNNGNERKLDGIFYWNDGIYRVVFRRPMRIKPKLITKFADIEIKSEIIPVIERRES